MESTWLDILPPDVLQIIWLHVHKQNMQLIGRLLRGMHTKISLWRRPSERLLDLVVNDVGCLQHPYTDLYKFRNKKFCGGDECLCSEPPYFVDVCQDCFFIGKESPWTEKPPNYFLYKCGCCEKYGFPCRNCATLFNGLIQSEIFYANFWEKSCEKIYNSLTTFWNFALHCYHSPELRSIPI